jgi:hypothetical protein
MLFKIGFVCPVSPNDKEYVNGNPIELRLGPVIAESARVLKSPFRRIVAESFLSLDELVLTADAFIVLDIVLKEIAPLPLLPLPLLLIVVEFAEINCAKNDGAILLFNFEINMFLR